MIDRAQGRAVTPGSLADQFNRDADGLDPVAFFYPCGFLYENETMTSEATILEPADRGHPPRSRRQTELPLMSDNHNSNCEQDARREGFAAEPTSAAYPLVPRCG
ncbi:MAG: hypothetical protein JO244_03410, partial [Solirubrobacterales bacterium]|nr:hypothetical protein [Solirubrobacterales bacterium]